MAFLGDLLIRLRAETADFQSDMGKAAYVADKTMRQIQGAAAKLGVALSAGGFVAMSKGAIDAADHLGDLNKITNISVEQLSGLNLLSKQSGSDLDHMAKGINNMSAEMGKNPDKFKALGITAKDSMGAFKQFADVFNNLTDQTLKSAIASETFGHKHWASMIPALSEGSKKIEEMVDKGSRLSGVTKEITDEADKFNDKWAELVGTGRLFTSIVGPMLPLLNSLADDMLKASDKTQGFHDSLQPTLETLRTMAVLSANVSFVFTTMGKDIARAIENVNLIRKGDFAGSRALGEMFRKDAEEARKALDEYEKKIFGLGLKGPPKEWTSGFDLPHGVDRSAEAAATAAAQAFIDNGKREAALISLRKRQASALQQMEEKRGQLSGMTEQEVMLNRLLVGSYKDFEPAMRPILLNIAAEIDYRKQMLEIIKLNGEAYESIGKTQRDLSGIQTAAFEADRAYADDLQFQMELLGRTAIEQQKMNELRRIELNLRQQLASAANAAGDNMEQYDRARDALIAQAEMQKAIVKASISSRIAMEREWASGARDAFNEYIDHATNAAENSKMLFTNAFRNMEDALVDFAKTGKLNFRSLANSIIDDLIRIQIRQSMMPMLSAGLQFVSGYIGGAFKPGTQAPAPVVERSFATGTDYVQKTGIYQLHQGEVVLTAAENANRGGGITFSPIINIDSRTDSAAIARTVDNAMRVSEARLIEQLNRGQGGITQAVRRA